MQELMDNLIYFIPVIACQFLLMLLALVHILRHRNYRRGSRALWVIVSVFFSIIGPILYFTLGRGEEE